MSTTPAGQENPVCPACGCKFTAKKGKRRNRLQLLQVYRCTECLHRFTTNAGNNVLVIFSDMRQDTLTLNLEHPRMVSTSLAMSKAEREHLLPDLHGVAVYALGVDGAGKDIAYWQTLRDFWTAYFKKTGANLKTYTVLRELTGLTQ